MHSHRTPSRLFSYLTTERLLLRTVLPSSLTLLIELILATHNRGGTQCGQACTGKARHHDEVARPGHDAARGLSGGSRRGGHRTGVILLLALVVGVALTAVLALLLSVVGLALFLVLTPSGLLALFLRASTLIGLGLLGIIVLGVTLCGLGLLRGSLIRIVLVRRQAACASHQRGTKRVAKLHNERGFLARRSNGRVRRLIRVVLGSTGIRSGVRV